MVPYVVMAVLFAVAAQLDSTEGQRKIPKASAAISEPPKERVNFDCPEEFGYYPHPSDCTQYYVCVFGGALLESCTGGLMYSHELQTCDWPRNVGCDGLELPVPLPSGSSSSSSSSSLRSRERERSRDDTRTKYSPQPPPPPAQPKAVVTSRGQPRQLHQNQEIIKQQLYADVEESLPPAEEVENDRQQRVYRGQPSTVGQVQRDRDGYRHTNALPSYKDRGEKIGVISFGTQSQLQHYSQEKSSAQTPSASTATATARTLYNSSQYNNNDNRYDPYYALYDDVELYRDVDYTQQNGYNTNGGSTRSASSGYRGSQAAVREETPKRGTTVYNVVNQDIYQQPSTVTEYNDNAYQEDDNAYRQSNRQSSSLRGDRNEIYDVEDVPTTKRTSSTSIRKLTTSTPRITTTTTQARTFPPKKSTITPSADPVKANETHTQALPINNTNPGHIFADPDPGFDPTPSTVPILTPIPDTTIDSTLHESYAVVKEPTPFVPPEHIISDKSAFHFDIKAPKSTHQISSTVRTLNDIRLNKTILTNVKLSTPKFENILPTTYSPPKYLLQSILPKTPLFSSPALSFRPINRNHSRTVRPTPNLQNSYKTVKPIVVRKLINPVIVNHELSAPGGATLESAEKFADDYEENDDEDYFDGDEMTSLNAANISSEQMSTTTAELTVTTSKTTINLRVPAGSTLKPDTNENLKNRLYSLLSREKSNRLPNSAQKSNKTLNLKKKKLVDDERKPNLTTDVKTDVPVNTSFPTRVSRVNMAIKSLIASGGTKGSSKCYENSPKCKVNARQRTNSRGRGTSHYSAGSVANNEVTVNTNRGTPAPRSRPTLKPSTSIVSKATEFIDIYRYPPRRPDPIYPQPQPDKTAAKCRKDVCLLPDCYCGGKDIPGDIPVEQVPQIVLLTFDDSVNDLNKGLYQDLFERGRTNPNGCPIAATFYVSHEWTDYSQVQNLYADGHELASHTVSHSFGEQFSQKKWTREVAGQREILSAYGGVKLEDVRGMRAPFLSVGGNKMFKMLYDSNFTYDSSLPIYENKPPSWPYTLDYKLFHDCMIPPCPTRSYPGVWEVPMVMWQDLNGGRCSMGDACSNPPDAEGVVKMLLKNFERHYTTNRAPFGLFYHAAWFTQPHHKDGFIQFVDTILAMKDVWFLTNWQAIQWVRDPTPSSRLKSFQPFQCDFSDRPKRCNNPKVCNLWHKSGVRYMRTCQPCPDIYPWTGNTGIRSSRIDNDIED
ncbi:uncharacterized protein LOC132708687 [Cylas formicarius]|uniref:uncharacterized protein LOC132708687 n=1 Tax=Cylas formicarius TaxID=197179 RepID=UPI00295891EB|nr:uncharacterized protein LOC132708687 [Cylas formicarius]